MRLAVTSLSLCQLQIDFCFLLTWVSPTPPSPICSSLKMVVAGKRVGAVSALLLVWSALSHGALIFPVLPAAPTLVLNSGCALLPGRLPLGPPLPVRSVQMCSTASDCPSSSPCMASLCVFGICTTPQVLPDGLSCDDNNTNTLGDVCTSGRCSGLGKRWFFFFFSLFFRCLSAADQISAGSVVRLGPTLFDSPLLLLRRR